MDRFFALSGAGTVVHPKPMLLLRIMVSVAPAVDCFEYV